MSSARRATCRSTATWSPRHAHWASRSVTKTSTDTARAGAGPRASASGCLRPILALSFVAAVFVAVCSLQIWYWQKIDAEGGVMRCKVDRKDERIDKTSHSDSWTQLFRVTLDCPWTDANVPMFPTFDTDEQEFDRIQKGAIFEMRYLPVPLGYRFLGVSAAHLARESADMHAATMIA